LLHGQFGAAGAPFETISEKSAAKKGETAHSRLKSAPATVKGDTWSE
jgi:hypothetical protein